MILLLKEYPESESKLFIDGVLVEDTTPFLSNVHSRRIAFGDGNAMPGNVNTNVEIKQFRFNQIPPLVFYPVTPCRIADSRPEFAPWAQPYYQGPFPVDTTKCYSIYGDPSTIGPQGGNQNGCKAPMGEPAAFHVVVTAVPVSGSGHVRLYPADIARPTASVLSWSAHAGNISNAVSSKSYSKQCS